MLALLLVVVQLKTEQTQTGKPQERAAEAERPLPHLPQGLLSGTTSCPDRVPRGWCWPQVGVPRSSEATKRRQ